LLDGTVVHDLADRIEATTIALRTAVTEARMALSGDDRVGEKRLAAVVKEIAYPGLRV
jgi:hypothetical protein